MKIGIIGAGIGGIAAGIRMAARGHEVDIFEANGHPGGKLSEIRVGDYRFDMGPSLFTMPQYVEELFEVAKRPMEPYFSYERLPVNCHYFWEDGTRLKAYSDTELMAKEVEEQLGVSPEEVYKILEDSRRKYELTGRTFLENSLHQWKTWFTRDVLRALTQLHRLDIFKSMHQANAKRLSHPKLIQFFDRFATYNGSNPYRAPGLLNIIPHFEQGFGAFFPRGGMYAITTGMIKLAEDLGVRFHYEHPVDQILTAKTGKKVKGEGLRVKGTDLFFDRIICNMDVFFAYKKLMPQIRPPKRKLKQEKSSSALIFYWGIKRQFPELNLHNILFSNDYEAEFNQINQGTIYHDPTVYINITQKYHPADAPEGGENWFSMINVPFNSGQNWDQLIEVARENILDKIKKCLGKDIRNDIEAEAILDPRSIENRTGSHLGALYGTSSNNKMAAFLRHPNFSSRIKNVFFVGGSVHPGGGIPLSLLSARIVDSVI